MKGGNERGIVLVAVLFAVAVMSVLVVAVTSLTRAGIASQRVEARLLATHFALRSGIESAKALIASRSVEESALFDGTAMMVNLGNGIEAEVTIRDAAALVDINRSEISLVEAALNQTLEPTEVAGLVSRIKAWRQQATDALKVKPAPGASTKDPAPAAKPDLPPLFLSVDQLLPMVETEKAPGFDDVITVFSPTGLVNPLAAAPEVLLAIPGFAAPDMAVVKAAKKARRWQADQRLLQLSERLKTFLAINDPRVFIIGVRLEAGPGIIPQATASAVVLLAETGPLPFLTLSASGL